MRVARYIVKWPSIDRKKHQSSQKPLRHTPPWSQVSALCQKNHAPASSLPNRFAMPSRPQSFSLTLPLTLPLPLSSPRPPAPAPAPIPFSQLLFAKCSPALTLRHIGIELGRGFDAPTTESSSVSQKDCRAGAGAGVSDAEGLRVWWVGEDVRMGGEGRGVVA